MIPSLFSVGFPQPSIKHVLEIAEFRHSVLLCMGISAAVLVV